MTRNLIFTFLALISISSFTSAQKPKTKTNKPTTTLSNAEKMGYERTNKYWGPGTYYLYAPGVVRMKMINNQETAMRDLTGISREDCITEITKQGFTTVPSKEMEKWFNPNKSKTNPYYYSPDKSYILSPGFVDMEKSVQKDFTPYATKSMTRYVLLQKQDSLKVIEMVWQYLRDLYEMKALLASFGSTFKKADPKAYPIEKAGSTGWNSMRAGTFVLRMVDGKPVGAWNSNEDIIRRTIGNSEFELKILGSETDFGYSMNVKLQKEGYVITYTVIAITLQTLEPGSNWKDLHKQMVEDFKSAEAMDKQSIDVYKKAPFPPVLEDINKLLHIK